MGDHYSGDMDKRKAMRQAHRIASLLISQAISTAYEGFDEDEEADAQITEALEELARRHYRASSSAKES